MPIPIGFARAAIANDTYPTRFENFVLALLSAEDGVSYLPTSRTYDLGRDARALHGSQDAQHIIAATTSRNIEPKVLDDVRRVSQTTKLASLTYCTSQDLTEDAQDGIAGAIRPHLPAATQLRMLALDQIASIALRHEEVLERHYHGELQDLRRFLARADESTGPEVTGLRLALLTNVGDDALELRQDICGRLVLEQLADGSTRTESNIAVSVSARLHLPRTIATRFLRPVVEVLMGKGYVAVEHGDHLKLTPEGQAFLTDVPEEAAGRLLEGREAVRAGITELLGNTIAEPDYERFWPVFRDGIAELFYQHGASIVNMVASLQSGTATDEEVPFKTARERLADRVAMLFTNAEQHDEIRQVVIDIFSRKGSKAFEWLTSVSVVYVMMSSLGLESLTAAEVSRILRGVALMPDTDVLLSLLCEGEENHSEVLDVVRGWKSLGGHVRAASPVLEEVAYHAWIADHDYAAVHDIVSSMSDERAPYLVSNAFVRTFRRISPNPHVVKAWVAYIREFRGRSQHDFSRIAEFLVNDFGVELIGGAVSQADALAAPEFVTFRRYLLAQAAQEAACEIDELDDITQDKARRDAILLTTVLVLRQRLRETAGTQTAVVMSSARALRKAAAAFRGEFDKPEAVVTIATAGALLAITPGVEMGISSLRALLFDVRLAKRLRPAELFVYRLLETTQYSLPLSRRTTASRRLREALFDRARTRGRRVGEEEADFLAGRDPAATAQTVRQVLTNLAIAPRDATTIEAQRRRITELEAEIGRLRAVL